MKFSGFEARCEAIRPRARPVQHAIEGVPAVIEQNPAARHGRIDAPILGSWNCDGDCRLRSQRPPFEAAHATDCLFGKEAGNPPAEGRFQPVVDRVHHAVAPPSGESLGIARLRHQGLLAEDVQTGAQRL